MSRFPASQSCMAKGLMSLFRGLRPRRRSNAQAASESLEQRLVLNALPLLDAAADLQFRTIAEDPGAPTGLVGTPVTQLVSNLGSLQNFSDADGDAPGIAVFAANLQGGTLWSSSDNGQKWQVVGNISESAPLLLQGADSRLYFQPAEDANGPIDDLLTIRAWDGTSSDWSQSVSNTVDTVRIDITSVNDVPVLDVQSGRKLVSTTMAPGAPVGAVGTLCSVFISSEDPLKNYADVEGAGAGVAITATSLRGGTLWYSTDNGDTWQTVGEVSDFSPLLLPAAPGNRLYYQPADGFFDPLPDSLTIRAWDDAYTWQKMGGDLNGDGDYDQSGHAVVLSSDGRTLTVAVPPNVDETHEQGQIRVYLWNETMWRDPSIAAHGSTTDETGWSVASSGDSRTLAFGVPTDESNPANPGKVIIRRHDGDRWTTLGSPLSGQPGDKLGWAVALSDDGNIVAVSSVDNSASGDSSGRVQVWRWNGSVWKQRGQNIDGLQAFDHAGYSLDLSADGNTLAVGSNSADNGTTEDTGRVDIYTWDGTSWVSQGSPIFGANAGDAAGTSLSLTPDGNSIAVGAVGSDTTGIDAGNVRVFDWYSSRSEWAQRGHDLNGVAAGDQSGTSVALAADGNTIIVGAPFNDGNGDDSGQARIWTWDGNLWNSVASLSGEAPLDQSGSTVSISNDGKTVAIGAKFNDGNGFDSGHARVYRLAPSLSSESQNITIDLGVKIKSPILSTTLQRPRIEWYPVPGATNYEIWISNSSAGINPWHRGISKSFQNWYELPKSLGVGKMDLWVRAIRNDRPLTPWSDMHRFTVNTASNVPDMTRRQTVTRPTIVWDNLPGAVSYDVWVNNCSTGEIQCIRDIVSGNSWTPSEDMSLGEYHIWVRGQAADGYFANWSVRQHFYVTPIPGVISDFTSTFDRTPTFQWEEIPGATSYTFFMRNQIDGEIEANVTGLPTPEWTPDQPLADGPYVWWGLADSSYSNIRSNWTRRNDFYVGGRTRVVGTAATAEYDKRVIHWVAVEGASHYELWVSTGGTTLIADQRQLTETQYQIPEALQKQTRYDVWVRAVSGDGEKGYWSWHYSFTLAEAKHTEGATKSSAEVRLAQDALQSPVNISQQQLTIPAVTAEEKALELHTAAEARLIAQSIASATAMVPHAQADRTAIGNAVAPDSPHLAFDQLAVDDWYAELVEQLELVGS